MQGEIYITEKFKPLFDILKIPLEDSEGIVDYSLIEDYKGNEEYYHSLSEVDTVIETSGRYGAKSYTTGLFINEATIQYDWKTLYTRFTNTSIEDSIESEFQEKIDTLNYNGHYNVASKRIKSKYGEGQVVFKGIKTSSNSQKANLKSLSGFNCFVVDEAEEVPSLEVFRKVYYSIRSNTKRNLSILILNQTDKENFIFKEFFEKRNVPEGFNGVVGNVLYINTNYLDLNEGIMPKNILREYNRLKIEEPEEYKNTILGAWQEVGVGKVYNKSELKRFKSTHLNEELVEHTLSHIDVANQGTDYLAQVIIKVIGRNIYLVDVVFSKENSTFTEPTVVELTRFHEVEHLWIETNGVGSMYATNIENDLYSTTVIPYHQTANKHAKIISKSGFIKKWVHFRSDYEVGSDYDLFMRNLLEYNKDKKKNTNIHDDAPDSLSSMINWLNEYIGDNWR